MTRIREVERPLTTEEVTEPLALSDLVAATFDPPLPPYGYRPTPGLTPPAAEGGPWA